MLCELAQNFPIRVAQLLERDRHLKRNFREETVTDLLMSSLVGLEPLGIRVDFPDEPTTGGDMGWIFAAPLEINGGRYLRLLLQAKRAHFASRKAGGYWFYRHLDHGQGQQAQTLVNYAATCPDGMPTVPLYMFYHPTSALRAATSGQPAVDGINILFADLVAPVVNGGCVLARKKISFWRHAFLPLSDLLCWPLVSTFPSPTGAIQFIAGQPLASLSVAGGFHPDLVAARLRGRREAVPMPTTSEDDGPDVDETEKGGTERFRIEPADEIPETILRAIDGNMTRGDREALRRPRVILSTRVNKSDLDPPGSP
jgi:hypothetical protein